MAQDIQKIKIKAQTAVTIGNFDGVHLGHRELIAQTVGIAKREGLHSAVLTFSPHPRIFFGADTPGLITVDAEKEQLLRHLGLDHVVIAAFNRELALLTPEAFVDEILVRALNSRHVVIGENNYFGVNKSGNAQMMQALCAERGIGVTVVSPVRSGEQRVSSERIRNLMTAGEIERANALLGSRYLIREQVIHGKGLGKTIGYPTINLTINKHKLLPKNGVYYTQIEIENRRFNGLTNVGVRPTVSGVGLSVETHILNFFENCYGETAGVEFLHQVREERRFASVEELKAQVRQDVQEAEAFFEGDTYRR